MFTFGALAATKNSSQSEILGLLAANTQQSSSDLRASLKNSIELTAGYQFGFSSMGIIVSSYLSSDASANFEYLSLSERYSATDENLEKKGEVKPSGHALSLNYRKFYSNTFYAQYGMYYRSQSGFSSIQYRNNGWAERDSASIEDIGMSLRIGNQWQWKKINIGFDWISINQTLTDISESKNSKKYTSNPISLLNLHFGVGF